MEPVLALDTSTQATSAATLFRGELAERRIEGDSGRPAHSPALLSLAHLALQDLGLDFQAVGTVAVCVGPGSFTGLRVGAAVASGLVRGSGAGLVGVGSLRALVEGAGQLAGSRSVAAFIDARRGELFHSEGRPGGRVTDPVAVGVDAVARLGLDGALCVGDGAVRFADELRSAGGDVPDADDPVHRVSSSVIAALASDPDCEGADVRPVYVRSPDAVPTAER